MPKGRYLAEFELYVMSALLLLGDEAYGVTIRQEIERRSGRRVAIGAVYATLARLADKGYVTSRVSDPLPVQGGRSRKFVRLTAAGRRALQDSTAMLVRMLPALSLGAGDETSSRRRTAPAHRDVKG
jgi:PadR family transcriptional regulator, regulatory protein PadR